MKGSRLIRAAAVGLAVMLGAGGCIFDPFGARLNRAQDAALALGQRVAVLEQAGGMGGAIPGTSTLLTTTMTPEGLPLAGGDLAGESLMLPSVTQAGVPQTSQWPGLPINWRGSLNKLVRGLVNVITGWVEVPKRVHETTHQSGAGPGFTLGFLRGLGYGFIRTAAGAYETITFLVPAPPDYQPVMDPAYVFLNDAPEEPLESEESPSASSMRRCPVGGELQPATEQYCPEHGVELAAP